MESMVEGKTVCGWTQLYHPSGAKVTIPVLLVTPLDMLQAVGEYISAGWLVNAPGLDEGEHKEECGWVARREKVNDDRSLTPIIDVYINDEAWKHPHLSKYLNNDEEVAAFEAAAGIKLISLPLYEGEGRIERGKNPKLDRYVVRVPRPFGFVWHKNPKWSEEEEKATLARGEKYFVARRKLVRWGEAKAVPAKAPENGKPQEKTPSGFVETKNEDVSVRTPSVEFWLALLKTGPDLEEFNKAFREAFLHLTPAEKKHPDSVTVYNKAKKYAEDPERAWEFDTVTKRWVAPVDSPQADDHYPF